MAAVLCVCCALAASGTSYEFIETERNVGVFTNREEATLAGLRVVFTSEVIPLQAIGIGSTFQLSSNEAGILLYEGMIVPNGMFEIDWALDGPRIDAAFWIDAEGGEWPIDVHSPRARMRFEVPPGSDTLDDGCVLFVPISIRFKGNWSKDPDGLPIERHQWNWSDGVVLGGDNVERVFWFPGWYTVTLTVWDLEGLSHAATESFYIYPYRCNDD